MKCETTHLRNQCRAASSQNCLCLLGPDGARRRTPASPPEHALIRWTFISLARADGARRDILESVTHGARGDILDMYTTLPWASVCEEVVKLKVKLRDGKVIGLRFSPPVENGDAQAK